MKEPSTKVRYNFLIDKETLTLLQVEAKERQTSVGALIRLATAKLANALKNNSLSVRGE
jgi:hypothetical protein